MKRAILSATLAAPILLSAGCGGGDAGIATDSIVSVPSQGPRPNPEGPRANSEGPRPNPEGPRSSSEGPGGGPSGAGSIDCAGICRGLSEVCASVCNSYCSRVSQAAAGPCGALAMAVWTCAIGVGVTCSQDGNLEGAGEACADEYLALQACLDPNPGPPSGPPDPPDPPRGPDAAF